MSSLSCIAYPKKGTSRQTRPRVRSFTCSLLYPKKGTAREAFSTKLADSIPFYFYFSIRKNSRVKSQTCCTLSINRRSSGECTPRRVGP